MLVNFEIVSHKELLKRFVCGNVGILVEKKNLKPFTRHLNKMGISFDLKRGEVDVHYFTFTPATMHTLGCMHQHEDYSILRDYTDCHTGLRVYKYTHGLGVRGVIDP